jgi:hypothetical protein
MVTQLPEGTEDSEEGGTEMQRQMKKRTGLPVLGTVNIVGGAVMVLIALDAKSTAAATLTMLIAFGSVAMGIGLIKGRRWAWKLAIAGYGLNVLLGLLSLNPVAVIMAAAILLYLNSTNVRAIFGGSPIEGPDEFRQIPSETHGAA